MNRIGSTATTMFHHHSATAASSEFLVSTTRTFLDDDDYDNDDGCMEQQQPTSSLRIKSSPQFGCVLSGKKMKLVNFSKVLLSFALFFVIVLVQDEPYFWCLLVDVVDVVLIPPLYFIFYLFF